MLRKAFQMFDTTKCGYIDVLKISTILNTMGQLFDDSELQALISENDPEGILIISIDFLFSKETPFKLICFLWRMLSSFAFVLSSEVYQFRTFMDTKYFIKEIED